MTVVRLRPPGVSHVSRRRLLLLLPVLVLALLAASSPAALAAYGPLWSQPVTARGAARGR